MADPPLTMPSGRPEALAGLYGHRDQLRTMLGSRAAGDDELIAVEGAIGRIELALRVPDPRPEAARTSVYFQGTMWPARG